MCHSSPRLKGVFKLMGSWIGIAHSHDQSRGKKEARIYETADQLHGYRPLRLILEIAIVQIPHLDYWGKSILTIFSWELVSPPTSPFIISSKLTIYSRCILQLRCTTVTLGTMGLVAGFLGNAVSAMFASVVKGTIP